MKNKCILLIDDDEELREVAQTSLEFVGGLEVITASSGAEGLVKAAEARPDAILLDVMMPDMDGPATFRKLQADPATSDIPVVMLTAKVQATDQAALDALGATGVLAKPFDPLQLPGQVAHLLGWPV